MLHRTVAWIVVVCAVLVSNPALSAGKEEAPSVQPRAVRILRQMTEYLKSLKQFTFHTENTEESVLSSGQKLQFATAVDVSVRRPNRLRGNVKGDFVDQSLFYNGQTVTLLDRNRNFYGIIKAPPTIEAALDYALETFDLSAPLSDLIYSNAYDILTENVESSLYVGLSNVQGVESHHLAFTQDDIDWQIWIENSETPLPRKFIITEKRVGGAPQFTARLSDWNVSPQLQDSVFTFVAPKGVEKIEFLPVRRTRNP